MRRIPIFPAAAFLALAAILFVVLGAASARGADESRVATPFTLTFENTGGEPNRFYSGVFSATAPLCAAGTTRDSLGITRRFEWTCADGTGTIAGVASGSTTRSFPGSHQILGGTGRYANLRGFATCRETHTPNPGSRLGARSSCEGIAAFDAVAPSLRELRVSAIRARRGARATVRASFRASDDVAGNAVSFALAVWAGGSELKSASGRVAGRRSLRLVVPLPRRERVVEVTIEVRDPVLNTRSRTMRVRVR